MEGGNRSLNINVRLLIRPKPEVDESFLGYILRLTEKNLYETPSWILKMAGLGDKEFRQNNSLVFRPHENLDGLTQLVGVNVDGIAQLLYPPVAASDSTYLHYFFGQPVPQDLIRLNRPKICPACLSESPYCRRVWEFSAVTACPTHRRLLIDECPKCKRRISWSRKNVTVCPCNFDWREFPTPSVAEQQLRLICHIYQLCGIPVAGVGPLKVPEPISRLSLNDLLRVLFFVAGQQRGISAATSRHLVAAGKSQNFHSILTEAYSVFEDWPTNYFRFLDKRRVQERNVTRTYQRMKSALYGAFGSFYSGLYGVLSGSQFDFMRIAFIDYITQKQAEDCNLSRHPRKRDTGALNRPYVLKSDARRLLGIEYPWIDHHVRKGEIKTLVQSKGKKRLIFVDLIDITKVKLTQNSC